MSQVHDTPELQATVVHFSPESMEPAVESRVGEEVVILDQDDERLIGYGEICASSQKGVRIRVSGDFPATFFDLQFMDLAEGAGIHFDPFTGLPPSQFEEKEVARYNNTKILSRRTYETRLKTAEMQRKIVMAILEAYQPRCGVSIGRLHNTASLAIGCDAGGMVFSKAIGELLAKGFFRLTYDPLNDEVTYWRL